MRSTVRRASPALGVAWMAFLGLVLPVLITLGHTRTADAGYFLQWVVVEHAAIGLSAALSSRQLRPMQLGFWAFAYLWLGIAPLAMLALDEWPLAVHYPPDVAFATTVIIEVGLVAYSAGVTLASSSRAGRSAAVLVTREFDRKRVAILAVVALLISVVMIPKLGGFSAFFASRQQANAALVADADNKAQQALVSWGVSVPAFWALLALLRLPRGEPRTRIVLGVGSVLVVLLVALNVVVNNPISQPRFWAGTVLLALVFTTRRARELRTFRVLAGTFVVLLLVVFPYSDYFRYAKHEGKTVTSMAEQLTTNVDYDAYQMMETGVQYVRDTGFHLKFALGPPLFAVPRAVWPGKPEDGGVVLARYIGYEFTNRSSPLWIESYMWGGLIMVGVVFLTVGVLGRRLDDLFDRHRGGDRMLVHLIVPVLAFYQLIVLRGSLLAAAAALSLLILTPLLVSRAARAPATLDAPTAIPGPMQPPLIYPGKGRGKSMKGQGGVTDRPITGGEERHEGSLAARLDVVRRRKAWVIGPFFVVLALALTYGFRVAPSYSAEAEVLVRSVTADPFAAGGVAVDKQVSMPTEQQLASSAPIADRVRKSLRLTDSPDSLLRHLRVSIAGTSQVLRFQVTNGDPDRAAAIANGFAMAYLADRRDRTEKTIQVTDDELTKRLKDLTVQRQQLDTKLASAPPQQQAILQAQRQEVSNQVSALQARQVTLASMDVTPGDITQPASAPNVPSGPSLLMLTLLGGFLGLVAGLIVAQVRESSDDRIRDSGEVARTIGATVLTSAPVPVRSGRRGTPRRRVDPSSTEAEAYRIVAVRLLRAAARMDARTILVVSARHREGRTTVVANLASALVEMGRSVVAVSADWRRPALQEMVEVQDPPELSSLLAAESADRIHALVQLAWQRQTSTGPGKLMVVESGDDRGSPAAMVTAPGLRSALSLWRNSADVVLVDSPPALSYSDALALVPLVDAVLVVCDSRRTRHRDLEQLAELLHTLEVPVVGAVTTRSGRRVRLGRRQMRAAEAQPEAAAEPIVDAGPVELEPAGVTATNEPEHDLTPAELEYRRYRQQRANGSSDDEETQKLPILSGPSLSEALSRRPSNPGTAEPPNRPNRPNRPTRTPPTNPSP